MPQKPASFGGRQPRKPWAHREGTAHERGYSWAWQQLRLRILQAEPLCRACKANGRATAARVVDHIVPKSEGGMDDEGNLQPLCQGCSDEKTIKEARRGRGLA